MEGFSHMKSEFIIKCAINNNRFIIPARSSSKPLVCNDDEDVDSTAIKKSISYLRKCLFNRIGATYSRRGELSNRSNNSSSVKLMKNIYLISR